MKLTTSIVILLIGIAIGVILTSELHCGGSKDKVITRIDTFVTVTTLHDSFYRDTGSIVRVPIKTEVPVYIKDTGAVIADYFTYYKSDDTLMGEDYEIAINDILYMNRLWLREASVNITKRDTTINTTKTITKSANGLYIGAQLSQKDIAPSVMYLKGRSAYGIGYGIKQKEITLQYHYKIR